MQNTTNDALAWREALAHRDDESATIVSARFAKHGISADVVAMVLSDNGSAMFDDVSSGRADWALPYGGLHGAALLAGEVAIHASHLVARAAAMRSIAVDGLLEDLSVVEVASELGVSRQKIYEIARGGSALREQIRGRRP